MGGGSQSCIKVALDFVSPENVQECLDLTSTFRLLPVDHRAREDKLEVLIRDLFTAHFRTRIPTRLTHDSVCSQLINVFGHFIPGQENDSLCSEGSCQFSEGCSGVSNPSLTPLVLAMARHRSSYLSFPVENHIWWFSV